MAEQTTKIVYAAKFAVLGLAIVAYGLLPELRGFISTSIGYLHTRDFAELRLYILSYGGWAPVAAIALMAIQSAVPLVPGLAITITNAWVFGWEYGAIYSWVGALLGALLDFGIARWYGRPCVEKLISPRYLDVSDRFFQRHGVLAVFITRLTPVIPFKVISYGAGLTTIPVWQYLLATGIGQTPAIILYSVLGQYLTRNAGATVAMAMVMMLFGAAAFYYRDKIEQYLIKD